MPENKIGHDASAKAFSRIALAVPSNETKEKLQEKKKSSGRTRSKGRAVNGTEKTAGARQKPVKEVLESRRYAQAPQGETAEKKKRTNGRPQTRAAQRDEKCVRVIPLGGIGEIGKNMTMIEYGDIAILIDCGLCFPDSELFGVDIVIPDFTYAKANKDRIKGLFITHGHEDHIGAIPYFLKELNVPIYGARLTLGLIEAKLIEHKMLDVAQMHEIAPGSKVSFGDIAVEAINVNHSIPDAMAYAINTPAGTIIDTGDFKIDFTPIVGDTMNLRRFGELGGKGVLALMSDSTNAEKSGSSTSESMVGESFERLFSRAEGKRLIIATFASNIQRVQQIIDLAERHGRRIAVYGRSMENYTQMAIKLGYLTIKDGVLVEADEARRLRPEDLIIITTGSQGEPMSALSRMAAGNHKQVTITPNDVIIISATPIPGNEKTVGRVINELLRKGSDVIYESMYDVHSSGHARRDELKLILSLVKPKYFIPVHGEYKHLVKHAGIAKSLGMDEHNIIIPETGMVIELGENTLHCNETVPSGRVLVDGLGVGDVGSIVLRDRKHLAEDGLIVVVCSIDTDTGELISGPDVISRGFVYVREAEELIAETREYARIVIEDCLANESHDWGDIKLKLREEIGQLLYKMTKRSPMVLPIIMEI